jgi:hypothetical protein
MERTWPFAELKMSGGKPLSRRFNAASSMSCAELARLIDAIGKPPI